MFVMIHKVKVLCVIYMCMLKYSQVCDVITSDKAATSIQQPARKDLHSLIVNPSNQLVHLPACSGQTVVEHY